MMAHHLQQTQQGWTRRQVLLGGVSMTLGWMFGGASALAQVAFRPQQEQISADVLVCLFLRGGADGLHIVVPYGEDAYYRLRPNLAIAAPGDRRRPPNERGLRLDERFALHPAMRALYPLFAEGMLAFVHGCGSAERSRSHFEAMSAMERGVAEAKEGVGSGWIARHLMSVPRRSSSPLRAVAFSNVLPQSLRGTTDALVLQNLTNFRLEAPKGVPIARPEEIQNALRLLYNRADGEGIHQAARDTIQVLQTLQRIDPQRYRPAHGAVYPDTELGRGLKQVAMLLKADVGLEVACLERGGWDTHVAQGSATGWMATSLNDIASSLAAFAQDMGKEMKRVTVVAMTEFGRRVRENSGLGTDHGRASVMLLLGGGIRGGRVYARWRGLEPSQLEAPGDLPVTIDYRQVLAEIVRFRLRNPNVEQVFPRLTVERVNIVG